MKALFFIWIIFFGLNISASKAQEFGINFMDLSWEETARKASKENKYIFLDAFATWCRPCLMMEKDIFPNEVVGTFFNNSFVNTRFDMEIGEGKKLSTVYEVEAYPTLLFFTSKGELLAKVVGYKDEQQLLQIGKYVLENGPKLERYNLEFSRGKRDLPFLKDYISLKQELGIGYKELSSIYLAEVLKNQLLDDFSISLIGDHVNNVHDFNDEVFQFFLKEREKFEEEFGIKPVHDIIYKICLISFKVNVEKISADTLKIIEQKLISNNIPRAENIFRKLTLDYFIFIKDYDSFVSEAANFMKLDGFDANELNNYAWDIYENSKNIDHLKIAKEMVMRSLEKQDVSSSNDTYAQILYVLGEKERAIKFMNRAVLLAESDPNDGNLENYKEVYYKMINNQNL